MKNIVVTVFLSILNQMEFHLTQNRKENCQHDHIPFNLEGNGIPVFSVYILQIMIKDSVLDWQLYSKNKYHSFLHIHERFIFISWTYIWMYISWMYISEMIFSFEKFFMIDIFLFSFLKKKSRFYTQNLLWYLGHFCW